MAVQQGSAEGVVVWLRRRWILLAAALLGLGMLLGSVLWFPRLLYPPLSEGALRGLNSNDRLQRQHDQLKLQNDARGTLLQGLGALLVLTGAGIGAAVTLRQVRVSQGQLQVAREQMQQSSAPLSNSLR